MKNLLRLFPCAALALLAPFATTQSTPTPPVSLTAQQDHQRLLDLLGIPATRPGVSSKSANYDESKATVPTLPNPLLLNNGKPVTSAKMWWKDRRPELVDLFDHEVYGRVPANAPRIRWEVVSTTPGEDGGIPTVTKKVLGHADNSAYPAISVDMEVSLTLPANAAAAVPVIIEISFEKYPGLSRPGAPAPPPEVLPTWKQQVLAKGWGYALFYPTTLQADNGAGLTQGIIGLANHGQPRKLDDWGTLRAWAWGVSRIIDYFQTDKAVDARHVGVEGHSRFGKTALVAMAYEPRLAVAYVSSSGAGGAALARYNYGEQLENVAASGEYHWMAGNYMKYASTLKVDDMPVDSHELIALCAPRPVFIGGGTSEGGDGWAATPSSFFAEAAASPVYQLLGAKGLFSNGVAATTLPPVGTALISGDLGFRQHPGGHTALPNWPTFIEFASRYLPTPPQRKPN
jgi:hypothetical protein